MEVVQPSEEKGQAGKASPSLRSARSATGACFLVNGAIVGAWVPYIPLRAHLLGLSAGRLGTVLLGAGMGAVMAMPLAGAVISRVGSRLPCVIGGLGFAAVLSVSATASNAWLLMTALVASGLFGAGMDVAMNAQAVLVEHRSGRRTLSSMHGLFSLGNVVGSLGVSAVLGAGISPDRAAYSVSILFCLLVALAAPWLLSETLARQPKTKKSRAFTPQVLLLGGLILAAMVSEGGTADWSGLYLRNVRGLGAGGAGVGFGIFSSAMLLGRLAGDRIVSALGELRTMRFGGLLAALGALAILLIPGRYGAFPAFALFGAGLANMSPVLYRAAGNVPGLPAGVGLATAVGMGHAGLLAGPPCLGGVAQIFGLRSIFLVLALLCTLLAASAGLSQRVGSVEAQGELS